VSATNIQPARSASADDAIDDLDAYIATLSDDEQRGIAIAGVAFDLVALLDRGGMDGASSEAASAEIEVLRQQVVSQFKSTGMVSQLGELQRYLNELGYSLALDLIRIDTGESVGQLRLPSEAAD
jgi:hypothetical protein